MSSSSQAASMTRLAVTAVAGAAAGIIASNLLMGSGGFSSNDSFGKLSKRIPAELLNSPYGEELKLAIQLAGQGT